MLIGLILLHLIAERLRTPEFSPSNYVRREQFCRLSGSEFLTLIAALLPTLAIKIS